MNRFRLIALFSIISATFFVSCGKDPDSNRGSRYISNTNGALTGTQQIPSNSSTGTGTIQGTYDFRTKIYTYKLTWSGLSSAVTGIHIHGLADKGFVALPAPLGTFASGIIQTASGNPTTVTGSYSSTLFIDGTVVREADLLGGKYYVDIHTANFPLGEIRGQILFQ